MNVVGAEEIGAYYRRLESDLTWSEPPELMGSLPTELISEFKALPRMEDHPYGHQDELIQQTIKEIKFAFASLVGVISQRCEIRYGWWTDKGKTDEYHLDRLDNQPRAVTLCVLGRPTQYIAGPCRYLTTAPTPNTFEPMPGSEIREITEGSVYEFGQNTVHREPPCEEPQNRLFLRTVL